MRFGFPTSAAMTLPLPFETMIDDPVDEPFRIIDELTVTRGKRIAVEFFYAPQGLQVVLHVAVRWIDYDGRPIDHMIASEQPVHSNMAIAKMVRRMTRRVHGVDYKLVGRKLVAITKHAIRLERSVLVRALGGRHAEQFRACRLRQQACSG